MEGKSVGLGRFNAPFMPQLTQTDGDEGLVDPETARLSTFFVVMQAGLIDVKPLISHTIPVADAKRAFELANDRSQAMKVQLAFSG